MKLPAISERSVAVAIAIWALVNAGCVSTPVAGAEPSLEALGQSVLDSLSARDMERLQALALNEEEFRTVVYPELPAARPERNLSFDFVWNDLRVKSDYSLSGTLEKYAGKPMTLVRVRFDGETTQYESYLVRRDSVLVVRTEDGQEQDVRLFGSVFEQDGRYKVFSYNVD